MQNNSFPQRITVRRGIYKTNPKNIEPYLGENIKYVGEVNFKEKIKLYNEAEVMLFPILWNEPFGNVMIESMACGTPVVASNSTSIPEVTGDAAVLVNPANVDEIAEKMLLVIKNERLQEELREKGLKRAKCFSWRKTAEETLELYKQVCNS